MENILPRNSKSRYQAVWPLCASLCLHALFLLILDSSSSLDLLIGKEPRFELFWLSPSTDPLPTDTAEEIGDAAGTDAKRQQLAAPLKRGEMPATAATGAGTIDGRENGELTLFISPPPIRPPSTPSTPARSVGLAAHPPATRPLPLPAPKRKDTLLAKLTAAEDEDDHEAEESQDEVMILPAVVDRPAVPVPAAPLPAPASPNQQVLKAAEPQEKAASASAPPESVPATHPAPVPVQPAAPVARAPLPADNVERAMPRPRPVKQAAKHLVPAAAPKPAAAAPQIKPVVAAPHPKPAVAGSQQKILAVLPQAKPVAARVAPKPLTAAAAPQPKTTKPATAPATQTAKVAISPAASAPAPAPPTANAKPANPITARRTTTAAAGTSQKPAGEPAKKQAALPAPAKREAAAGAVRVETPPQAKPGAGRVAEKPDKPPEPKGMVIASLRGDLKMIITGDSSVRLFVTFRPYPKSRRDRVTRSEAREQQKVSPLIAKTRPETREAVVETAREGVYTFSAQSGKAEGARAVFTLKIFESGSREKIAAIGSRAVTGKTVLAKVLMPEGILWDDEAAFTGSLEDSDSTTKFNAQTGVYWKEFND